MNKINKKDKLVLSNSFNKLKEEMTDHLNSINENTNEINYSQSIMNKMEQMIQKLNERMDDIELKLNQTLGNKIFQKEQYANVNLTPREKEIFFYIYESQGQLLDYRKIARSLGYNEESIRKHISSLITKQIPIQKKHFDGKVYLILDSDFKNLQAKENIVNI